MPRTPGSRSALLVLAAVVAAFGTLVGAAAAATPSDPSFPRQWGLHNTGQSISGTVGVADADIDAPEAWDVTTGSSSVTVANLDDGINVAQGDLAPNLVPGYDFGDDDPDPAQTVCCHGDQTAAVVAARGNNGSGITGVNWTVGLMPLKVRADGPGERFDLIAPSAVVNAIRHASSRGVRIVTASFALRTSTTSTERAAVLSAIREAPNTLFLFSAGNSTRDLDANPRYPCSFDLPNLICVGASDQNDNLWSSSNYGARTVDLVAPGVRIYSYNGTNTFGYVNGTSYSTPMVAGVAALYLARYPGATTADVRHALLSGVDKKAGLTGKVASGGRLNAARTLAVAPSSPAPDTTPPPVPSVSPVSGTYTSAQQVTMAVNEAGSSIRYTVGNGTTVPEDPTAATGSVYNGQITVGASQVLKAAAFDTAGNRSTVVRRDYTISTPTPGTALARDSFSRTQSIGWGSASPGGAWTILAGGSTPFTVNGSRGLIATPTGGVERHAALTSLAVRDVDAQMEVTFPDSTGSTGAATAYLTLRRSSSGYLRIGLAAQGGKLYIRGQDNAANSLFSGVDTGLAAVAGGSYALRIQADGASPTNLRVRAWRAGDPEPATWNVATTSNLGPQVAGSVGIRAVNTTQAATTLGFDDVAVSSLGG